jgi:hypothetical protein
MKRAKPKEELRNSKEVNVAERRGEGKFGV